jgi:hypothetical protein
MDGGNVVMRGEIMKSILFVVVLSAVLGAVLGTALGYVEARLPEGVTPPVADTTKQENQSQAGPVAEVPETTFNFDRIERGTSMKHKFKIRNVGDAPLHLEVVSTTCKCTVGDLANNEIAPGEQTEVELEWTAKTAPGPFRHGATLSSNDPRHSRIELVVEGEVVESTVMQPADLFFGPVSSHDNRAITATLVSNLEEEVKIIKHEFSDPEVGKHIKLDIVPLAKDELPTPQTRGGVKITATFEPGKSLGPFFTWLVLETNLEKAPKLTVPVTGTVKGDIAIFGTGWNESQGVLRLGLIDGKQGKHVRLNLAIRGEHAPNTKLEIASVDPPELQVSLGEPKEMSKQLVHVPLFIDVPAGTRPMVRIAKTAGEEDDTQKGDGVIVLKSTHPDTEEVRLLVRFSVD